MQSRITIVLLFFFAVLAVLIGRLFILQVVQNREYTKLAARQHRLIKEILPERGIIYVQEKNANLIPLAMNKVQKNITVSPQNIKDERFVASLLAKEFGVKEKDLLLKLADKSDLYEVLIKNADSEKAKQVEERRLDGLFLEEEKRRVYPHGSIASHLLGFVSKEAEEEEGRYGLERYYEAALSGNKGFFEGAKDNAGFWVALGRRIVRPPKNGSNLVLTIDYNIQSKTEVVLEGVMHKWQAVSGTILVTEPKTGRILAMASRPVFDPNNFSKERNLSVFLNPLVESMYELGSVLKPVTMAGGLEEKLVTPDSTYEDPGSVKFGSYTVRNFDGKSYKTQTMTQVLEKSLNTGAVYVARLLGKERQLEYLKRFGFGEKTAVDLPGEITGDLSNLSGGKDIDFATASFGQGIAVTPMQLAMAIGVIANGGNLMKPHVVERVIDDSGNESKKNPEIKRNVLSKETAEKLTQMLVSAVKSGFENRAGVKGYFVAGKTGTAQVPRRDARGYSDKVIHTFVGYAPAFNPRFLVLLQLNEPKGNRFAANTLTPAFHDVAEFILNYYEIPPDEVN